MAWKIVTSSAIKTVDYRPQRKDHHCPVAKSIPCRQQHNFNVSEGLHIFHAAHKIMPEGPQDLQKTDD